MVMPNLRVQNDATPFRNWFKEQLKARGFYLPAEDKYAVAAFSRYCTEKGEPIDAISLGRYLKDDGPLPSDERCRQLARVLNVKPIEVLKLVGRVHLTDF